MHDNEMRVDNSDRAKNRMNFYDLGTMLVHIANLIE